MPYRGGRGLLSTPSTSRADRPWRSGVPHWRASGGRWPAAAARPWWSATAPRASRRAARTASCCDSNPHLVLDGLQLAAEAVGARQATLYLHPDAALRSCVLAAVAGASRRPGAGARGDRCRPLPGRGGVRGGRPARGGPGLPRVHAAAGLPARGGRAPDAGPERRRRWPTSPWPPATEQRGSGRSVPTPSPAACSRRSAVPGGAPWSPRSLKASHCRPWCGDGRLGPGPALGGYHGAWVPVADALGVALSPRLARGSGPRRCRRPGLAARQGCGLVETARVMSYLADESAGQCGPCLNGLPRIALARRGLAAAGPAALAVADLHRWAGLVEGRGACHHPDGSVRFLRSALTTFAPRSDTASAASVQWGRGTAACCRCRSRGQHDASRSCGSTGWPAPGMAPAPSWCRSW